MNPDIVKIAITIYDYGDFKYHIIPVVKNALLLAKKLKVDTEVVETAAYLHDIGRAKRGEDDKHHITGAKEARKILQELDYDEIFIKKVEHCILAHRGKNDIKRETIEAEIVACADAMAHFDTFLNLFTFFLKKGFEEAITQLEAKIDRDWNKKLTLAEAKELVKDKYKAVKLLIKSMKDYV